MIAWKNDLTRAGYPNTAAIDDRIVITGMCHNGEHALLHIGLATDLEALDMYRRVLASGSSLRFLVAGNVVALDLMAGPTVVGRLLTSLANAVLIELVDCGSVEVTPFLADDPSTRSKSFDLPAARRDVSLEELYGDPKVFGYGPHIRYDLNKISGEWAFHRYPTLALAEANTPPEPAPPTIDAGYDEPICAEFSIAGVPPTSWNKHIFGPGPN